jgi:outer membrane protein TolC
MRTLIYLALATAGALPVVAQSTNVAIRPISLDECVEMTLKNNFDLRIERINYDRSKLDLSRAETLYDPTLNFATERSHSANIDWAGLYPTKEVGITSNPNRDTIGYGVSGSAPMGFSYDIPFTLRRTPLSYNYSVQSDPNDVLSPLVNRSESFSSFEGSASINMQQRLLKGFSIDAARANVLITKKNIKMNEYNYQSLVIETLALTQTAYFDLIAARENVTVQIKAVELAEKLLADNRAKVKAGTLPPLDEKQAESQAAVSRADLLTARQKLLQQENVLKNYTTKDAPQWKNVSLVPTAMLVAIPEVFDVQESWRTSMIKRPDLARLRVGLERNEIDIRYYKNQTLPDLSLVGSYGRSSLSSRAESMYSDLHFRNRAVSYSYGVQLSFPWGNRDAKYRLAQAKQDRDQADLILKQLQQSIMIQVDNAINAARNGFDRVGATRQAREYAEQALVAEQKKLENGKSTSYTVLQMQRDLTNARSAEITALTDYNKALSDVAKAEGSTLERLKVNLEIK